MVVYAFLWFDCYFTDMAIYIFLTQFLDIMKVKGAVVIYHKRKLWTHCCKQFQTSCIGSVEKDRLLACSRLHFKQRIDRGTLISLSFFQMVNCCNTLSPTHYGAVNGVSFLCIPVFTQIDLWFQKVYSIQRNFILESFLNL